MRERVQAAEIAERPAWGFYASAGTHAAALLIVLLLVPGVAKLPEAPEEKVLVDVVTAAQLDALTKPSSPEVLRAPSDAPAASAGANGMVQATRMLGDKALADPRSRRARADLATFAVDERAVQLCNLEAMEQIAAWEGKFQPDNLVAYARAEETIAGDSVKATGAAFHSGADWYDLSFDCSLDRRRQAVVAFAFKVGNPIPTRDWARLGLPSGPDDD